MSGSAASIPPLSGFRRRLQAAIAATGTSLCIGVDPPLSLPSQLSSAKALPDFAATTLREAGPAAFLGEFSQALIEAGRGVTPAIKFQSAFFEAYGPPGFAALQTAITAAKAAGLLTILDAKRGDIASTMAAYGHMAFEFMAADALTVTPYMGLDTVEPLLPWLRQGRGVYLVWVSSNPGGALIQDCELAAAGPKPGGRLSTRVFRAFADYLRLAGADQAFGLVAGATRVEALAPELLAELPSAALLMPGVGAQGGTLSPQLKALAAASGTVLVPQSRSLAELTPQLRSWDDFRREVTLRVRAVAAETRLGG